MDAIIDRLATALEKGDGPPGIVSAYLFGSHAAGRQHRESDVDVGVLLDYRTYPTAADRFEARLRLSSWLRGVVRGRDADVVVLNDCPPLLGRRIVTEGRRVFCGDPERDHAYRRDVQLKAADLEPFLRRMRVLKLRSLSR